MKRYVMTLLLTLGFAMGAQALDYETAREQAYYLTDKMAYELNLNEAQYNDAYEINLDYLLSLNSGSDINTVYLDYRNADLRYILYDWQWATFLAADYFLRPVQWYNGGWYFPVFRHYTRDYFFYDRPGIYWEYRGAHGRVHVGRQSFYTNRRPHWEGGLRGRRENMIGHPGGGRYGSPNTSAGRRGDTGYRMGGTRTQSGTVSGNRQSNSTGYQGNRNGMGNNTNSRSSLYTGRGNTTRSQDSYSVPNRSYREDTRYNGSSVRSSSRSTMDRSTSSGRSTTSRSGTVQGGSSRENGGGTSRTGRR